MGALSKGLIPLRSPRWCVFVSGRGSNLASVLETSASDLRLVISSSQNALALSKARRAGVATFVAPRVEHSSGKRSIDWSAVSAQLKLHSIDAIFLLGFMHVVPASVVDVWRGRMLNVHPSLLPKYSGIDSIARSVAAKDDCGVSVHHVSEIVDAGQILSQRVSVTASEFFQNPGESLDLTPSSAELRVHIDEQRMVCDTIEKWRPHEN